jgi:hypothetical protein
MVRKTKWKTLAPSAFDLLNYHKVCFANLITFIQYYLQIFEPVCKFIYIYFFNIVYIY